jgi:hypothetical protein
MYFKVMCITNIGIKCYSLPSGETTDIGGQRRTSRWPMTYGTAFSYFLRVCNGPLNLKHDGSRPLPPSLTTSLRKSIWLNSNITVFLNVNSYCRPLKLNRFVQGYTDPRMWLSRTHGNREPGKGMTSSQCCAIKCLLRTLSRLQKSRYLEDVFTTYEWSFIMNSDPRRSSALNASHLVPPSMIASSDF